MFFGDMCRETVLEMEALHSAFTFQPLHNNHQRMSRLTHSFPIQYSTFEDGYSHSAEPSGKQKELSLQKTPLLSACNGILAHSAEQYLLPGLHVSLARREITAQLNGLLTKCG